METRRLLWVMFLLGIILSCNTVAKCNQFSNSVNKSYNNVALNIQEVEPNNTYQTANTFALNGSVTGAITLTFNADNYDYYKVTLPSDGKIALSLSPLASLDAYLDLYDQNGWSFLRASLQTGVGVTDLLVYENLKAGTYYIRVGGGGDGSYTLTNTFTATAIPNGNDAEPNDNKTVAKNINVNVPSTGHIGFWGDGSIDFYDWYSFTLPFDGKIDFTIVPENTLDAYLDLYDQNGQSFLRRSLQTGVGVSDLLVYENLKAGTYFISVGCGGYGSYTLNNVFTPTAIPGGNDTEPNDTYSTAIPVTSGSSTTGHIGYWGNGSSDNSDWFSFSFGKKSEVTIRAIPENSLDIVFDIYNAIGNTFLITGSNKGMGQTDSLVLKDMAAGSYYIRVFGGGWGSYTLSLSIKEAGLSVENSLANHLEIIPDINKGILMINHVPVSDFSTVRVYSMNGKMIMKERLPNVNNQIVFSGRKGVYLVEVITGKATVKQKVVF